METLLKIWETDRESHAVNARDLYNFLENKSGFSHWINNRIKKYGFEENKDYYKLYFNIYGNEVDIEDYISGRIDYYVTSQTWQNNLLLLKGRRKELNLLNL
jgi:phage transcriptional regulator (fragment)